jgi:Glycerol-3-phosphate responsive antiterminator (mRNA-binding)
MSTHRSPSLEDFVGRLAASPCCAAIVADEHLGAALASRAPILFILRGNGLELAPVIRRIHDAGKLVAVHLDLVDGLRDDHCGVAWLARSGADAIITSRGQLISVIRDEGLVAIQRLLLSRRSHLDTAVTAISRSSPHIVEVLPGVILPKIAHLMPHFRAPVLAGGFVRTEADARAILAAGAIGVTTSSPELWALDGV